MTKQKYSSKIVYKIHTKRLKRNNWNLNLTFVEAVNNKEVIKLADSQTLNFIDSINGITDREEKIINIKTNIKQLTKEETTSEIKKEIKKLHEELNKNMFIKDYVCIVMNSVTDFNRCNTKKGFFINGEKYKRLLGTTGGIKNSTIVYVNENIYDKLTERINNGRDISKKLIPAKLEAYKSLTCSASIPVSNPKGILVVNDCITKYKEDIIRIDDTKSEEPIVELIKNAYLENIDSDGYGLITKELSEKWSKDLDIDYIPSGVCIRNSWCKGMLFTFPINEFAEKVAHKYMVKDVWGKEHDIRNIQMILTVSMLKLWDSYKGIDDYINNCNKNGYTFRVTKICPKKLENSRTLNYQFIQSFELNDEDIEELIEPTIEEIQGSLGKDYAKSILFLKGINLNSKNILKSSNDYIKALMIEPRMINDIFIQEKIRNMRKKRINDSKVGVLNIEGNYGIISGDPYSLCQSIFGLEVTGLLKAGECYSKYWIDRQTTEILAFRPPMTCHNNIRKLKVVTNDKMEYWYKYMTTCNILNSWDSTCMAENGADKDSDAFITTSNKVLLRNFKQLPAISCIQKSATKIIPTDKDIELSNKNGFGDEIGTTTNRVTEMFDILAQFDKESIEYKILMNRIMCGQHYQQCAIDKIKGIKSKPMPSYWYRASENFIKEEDDKEIIKRKILNQKIVADKKPYFFIYIYPELKNRYNKFIKETSDKCMMEFGISINELFNKENKNEEELNFIKYYSIKNPVSNNSCVMNRICKRLEKEFSTENKINFEEFDKSILKTEKKYTNKMRKDIKKIYEEYIQELKKHKISIKRKRINREDANIQKELLKEMYKQKCIEKVSCEEDLCNILVDMCYEKNNSKQFVWDMCGNQIIENLLIKNNGNINYPELDDKGNIYFNGELFTLKTIKIKEDNIIED